MLPTRYYHYLHLPTAGCLHLPLFFSLKWFVENNFRSFAGNMRKSQRKQYGNKRDLSKNLKKMKSNPKKKPTNL